LAISSSLMSSGACLASAARSGIACSLLRDG
jgi:hypothetical protein